jgi:Flp pilus assembly protein TadD
LQRILEDDPNDATACNDLGYFWADQNRNLPEAERLIRKAIELDRKARSGGTAIGLEADRDNAAYVDSLGWVLFRQARLREAREELERSVGLPDGAEDPTVWDHLGDTYERLEQPHKAREAWRLALKLFEKGRRRPQDDQVNEIQQKLKRLGP